jgi:hypothetical protein
MPSGSGRETTANAGNSNRDDRPADVRLRVGQHDCIIRTLPISEAQPLFYSWTAAEGWDPGLHDPTLYSHIDPHGFHALYVLDPAASASSPPPPPSLLSSLSPACILSTLIIDDGHGFLGPFITAPAHRRCGLGSALFSWGLSRLQPERRRLGLDSTVEQQGAYKQRGFHHIASVEQRYAGIVAASSGDTADAAPSAVVVAAADPRVQRAELHRLFASCSDSKMSTPPYVDALLSLPDSVALAALSSPASSSSSSPALVGLAVARKASSGFRLAPLLAVSAAVARQLLVAAQAAVGVVGGEDRCGLRVDVPSCRTEALQLMETVGLRPVFSSVRMSNRKSDELHPWLYGSEPCP